MIVREVHSGRKTYRFCLKKYKLTPLDPLDKCWDASDTNVGVEVEANDELSARDIASAKYDRMRESTKLVDVNYVSPWVDPKLTSVEEIS